MAMGTREPLKGGAEWDYLTRGRCFHRKVAGRVRLVKQTFWQRVRKAHRLELAKER